MEKYKLNSVEEMFRWRLEKKVLDEYNLQSINYPSVEKVYSKMTSPVNGNLTVLNWEITDVLYSFVLIYYLGLKNENKERFDELFSKEKENKENFRLKPYSASFLFKCSRDSAFNNLNRSTELTTFIQSYFSIGNVIPIWPGGNEARGKMGIYDIPELFFNYYSNWTKELERNYKNSNIDIVVENELFEISHKENVFNYKLKEHEESTKSLSEFVQYLEKDREFYYKYLAKRNEIIEKREQRLNKLLEGTKRQ